MRTQETDTKDDTIPGEIAMPMRYRVFLIVLILFCFSQVTAGPTVVRDNRITDIGITPVLGRGYSISTNTLQSTCIADIKRTPPSYDLRYTFSSIEYDEKTGREITSNKPVSSDRVIPSGDSWQKWRRKITRRGRTRTVGKKKYYKHRMIAVLNLDSYYSSVDEANSKLSASATKLLTDGDLPGFFAACGPYYIRSINRRAKLISIFEYETETNTRSKSFEGTIESNLKGFRKEVKTSGWWFWRKKKVTWKQNVDITERWNQTEKFNKEATSKKLNISTVALGLGKQKDATIVSYDITSYKKAIKDAFKSMQDPQTGKVISVETVPWVENSEFQALIKLNEKLTTTVPGPNGTQVTETKNVPLFRQKYNLIQNSEFLTEINRNYRNRMNIYYKAKLCKQYMDENWRKNGNKEWRAKDFGKRKLVNLRTGAVSTTDVDTLYKMLTDELQPTGLFQKAQDFMYKLGAPSGFTCIQDMLKWRMLGETYSTMNNCSSLRQQMGVIINETIDDHCMPKLD